MPTNSIFLSRPLGVQERPHAEGIQTARLHQVGYGEAVNHFSLHVPQPEVKPLRVLLSVHVCTQRELVVEGAPEQARTTRTHSSVVVTLIQTFGGKR